MKKNKYILLSLFAFALGNKAQAQKEYTPVNVPRILVRAFPFQNFTYTAREAGLAEAGVAITPDANAGFMNPAKYQYLNLNTEESLIRKTVKVKRNGIEADSIIFVKANAFTQVVKIEKNGVVRDSLIFNDEAIDKKKSGISINYTPYYRNLKSGMNLYALNAYRLNKNNSYGLTARFFDAGVVEIYNQANVFQHNHKAKELALTAYYSFFISENKKNALSLGLNFIHSNIAGSNIVAGMNTKETNALSANVYYFHNGFEIGKRNWLNYGATLTNIGPKVNYGDSKRKTFQPTLLKIGIAQNFTLSNVNAEKEIILMLTADANKLLVPTPAIRDDNNNVLEGKDEWTISGIGTIFQSWGTAPNGFKEHLQEVYYSFGAELQVKRFLFGRIGYYTQNKNKGDIHYLSLGLGAKLKQFQLDGAYLFPSKRNEILKNTFRIGLIYQGL